jgi:hypothetical protein
MILWRLGQISESGIRLVVKPGPKTGQEVTLRLEGRSVPTQDGSNYVGVRLDKYLPCQEIVGMT